MTILGTRYSRTEQHRQSEPAYLPQAHRGISLRLFRATFAARNHRPRLR
jgi:hypothetical protein